MVHLNTGGKSTGCILFKDVAILFVCTWVNLKVLVTSAMDIYSTVNIRSDLQLNANISVPWFLKAKEEAAGILAGILLLQNQVLAYFC